MKKNCVFYHQGDCGFKEKKIGIITCTLCKSYHKENADMTLKEWYILANTNKNFFFQIMLTLFTLGLSAYVIYDRQITIKKIDKLNDRILILEKTQQDTKKYIQNILKNGVREKEKNLGSGDENKIGVRR